MNVVRILKSSSISWKKLLRYSYVQKNYKIIDSKAIWCTHSSSQKSLNTDEQQISPTSTRIRGSQGLQWIPIYRFPYIVPAAMISRLKLYQTALTVGMVPLGAALCHYDMLSSSSYQMLCGLGVISCCTLYIFGNFFRRVVGIIYISQDRKYVKASHLSFWGRRRNIEIPVTDVIPLLQGGCNPDDIYVKLQRYSSDQHLNFSIRYGKILEPNDFEEVFGSLKTW